ncbi:efflux RND transporter periplasmic adaptor subunit [Pararobbsia alpina]|uniref:Multidrug resistance protein MdtA n=1 Tax=Pararobbsia alpina TaxID=621374 RepID=A0A6S7BJ88_9BURK|nr:efflux RND transporter periplasmic adaptor subunit [Pararobbsia alpina]CAB3802176.1 Multidrug resistance protein MdtA [Pararobbsia alpina]
MNQSRETSRTSRRAGYVLLPLVAVLLAIGIIPKLHADQHLQAVTKEQETPIVQTIHPGKAPATQDLTLPGSVAAFSDASIYARTSGYVAHWYVDIGTRVKAGTLLATIEAPEVDAQLNQARADRVSAQANYAIANTTAQRWQELLKTQSVAQQETDLKVSDMQAKRAMLDASTANVERLAQMQSFEKVVAPFDGVVTSRNVDVGTLVDAGGNGGGTSTPTAELFHMQQTQALRVYVQVPEASAPLVVPGTHAYLMTSQYPGRRFVATVSRISQSVTADSRTMLAEIDVDNADGALMPGVYAEVHLALQSRTPTYELPVNTLLFRPSGVTVATVDTQGTVHLKVVKILRDFGTFVEIANGLDGSENVISNPGDSIYEGAHVQVQKGGTSS